MLSHRDDSTKEPPCPASPPPHPCPSSPAPPTPAREPAGPGHPRQRPRDPRLSAAEERALAEAVARGDADARERFIRANLGLVRIIAPLYRDMGLDLDDLIGEGHLGLIRAVERFDPAAGVRFSTYAACCIKTAIRDALTQTASTVRLPAHIVKLLARWRQVEWQLGRELGHAPTAEQVAGGAGPDRLAAEDDRAGQAGPRLTDGRGPGGGDARPGRRTSWRTVMRGPGRRWRRRTRGGG